MNPIEDTISNFQELIAEVPELVQPLIVILAGAIPFVEGEGGAIIGVVGGLHPVVTGVAAATGNFLSVLLVVSLTSRARRAVVDRRRSPVGVAADAGTLPTIDEEAYGGTDEPKTKSEGRRRFDRWVVRFGVPGASILGPLAIPTQFTAAALVSGGTPRRWVLLWQAIAIVIWSTVATVSVWAALTYLVEVS